ncbi:hypothetical protein BH10ACT3_BH10ACT3_08290 [soil metagenome]
MSAPTIEPAGKAPKPPKAKKAPKTATAKSAKYRYEAETISGENVKGAIQAPSMNAARNELAVKGLRVTKIVEKKGLNIDLTKEKFPLV